MDSLFDEPTLRLTERLLVLICRESDTLVLCSSLNYQGIRSFAPSYKKQRRVGRLRERVVVETPILGGFIFVSDEKNFVTPWGARFLYTESKTGMEPEICSCSGYDLCGLYSEKKRLEDLVKNKLGTSNFEPGQRVGFVVPGLQDIEAVVHKSYSDGITEVRVEWIEELVEVATSHLRPLETASAGAAPGGLTPAP